MTPQPPAISADLEAYVKAEHVDFRATLAALTATVLALDGKVGHVLAVAVETKAMASATNGRVGAVEMEQAIAAAIRDDRARQLEVTRAARAGELADAGDKRSDAADQRSAVTLTYTRLAGFVAVAAFMLTVVGFVVGLILKFV